MPTCSIVCLEFSIEDWSEVSYGNGELVFFETPKNLHIIR